MKIQLWHTSSSVLYSRIATMTSKEHWHATVIKQLLSEDQTAKSFLFVLGSKELSELDT